MLEVAQLGLEAGFHARIGRHRRRAGHAEDVQRLAEVLHRQALGRVHLHEMAALRCRHRGRRGRRQDHPATGCGALREPGIDLGAMTARHARGHAFHLEVELLQDRSGCATTPRVGHHHAGAGNAEQPAQEAQRDRIEETDIPQGAARWRTAQAGSGAVRVEDAGYVQHDEAFRHDFPVVVGAVLVETSVLGNSASAAPQNVRKCNSSVTSTPEA
ncbi:hypothetical protein D3C81_1418530 [compost metagenome]